MLTLEETLASQNNLELLCADRSLETGEVFVPNAYYGGDRILKTYARLPLAYALKVVVPHGPYLDENYLWEAERYAHLPAVLCYPPYREPVYVNTTSKVVIPSAAPFLYLHQLLKHHPQPERKGTIFFPYHSTHYVTIQTDFDAIADGLAELDDKYKPVTVCIYWRDFNLGHHIPFKQRGLQIVSAGHIYDPLFLYRLYHLCSMHQYSAGNEWGSHLFYSVKAGCSYFHLDTIEYILTAEDHILKRDLGANSPVIESTLRSLFNTPVAFTTAEQTKAVDYYLGAESFKSPAELRSQLLYAEMLDKAGVVVCNQGRPANLTIPAYYYRVGAKIKQIPAYLKRVSSKPQPPTDKQSPELH